MSDIQTEQTPWVPVLAEPEEDEISDEMVPVRGGFIRVTIAGVMYKLRRPWLGELEELEATLDAAQHELQTFGDQYKEIEAEERDTADRIRSEAKAADDARIRLAAIPVEVEAAKAAGDDAAVRRLQTEARKLSREHPPERFDERIDQLNTDLAELSIKVNERIKQVQRFSREARKNWWQQVFTMLTPSGHPEPPQMPAWVGDPILVQQVLEHWQSSPLAHGRG